MIRRVGSTVVAAVAVAGLASVIVPQHAASLAALAAATVAAVTAALVLVATGPLVAARPPAWPGLRPDTRAAPPLDPQGLRDARRAVAAHVRAGADPCDLLDPARSTARPTPTGGTR